VFAVKQKSALISQIKNTIQVIKKEKKLKDETNKKLRNEQRNFVYYLHLANKKKLIQSMRISYLFIETRMFVSDCKRTNECVCL